MRSRQQITKLKKAQSPPVSITDISIEVDKYLNFYYENKNHWVIKNTGPTFLQIEKVDKNNELLQPIVNKLKDRFGSFKIRTSHIFDVTSPHVIHNDDTPEYPNSYKAFTIPLKIYGKSNDLKLVLFDQYYYHGPAKFFNGDIPNKHAVYYNKPLCNYKYVSYKSNLKISDEIYKKYLTHCKKEWLDKLSINTLLDWKLGNILCFDSLQLHCSSNFRNNNVSQKIGLSIFTVKDD